MAPYNSQAYQPAHRPFINKARKAVEKYVKTGDESHLSPAFRHLQQTTLRDYGPVLDDLLAARNTNWLEILLQKRCAAAVVANQAALESVTAAYRQALDGTMYLATADFIKNRSGLPDIVIAQACGFQTMEELERACLLNRFSRLLTPEMSPGEWEDLMGEILRSALFSDEDDVVASFGESIGGITDVQKRELEAAWDRLI